jgi:hypothetical protein
MEKAKIFINSEEKPSTEYEYRKVQGIMGEHSFSIVLPKSYALAIGITKGDSVKVIHDSDRLIVEKA